MLLMGGSLTVVGLLYDDWGYRQFSITDTAHFETDPHLTYILRKQKLWKSLPGPEFIDIQLTHQEYVRLLLDSEFETQTNHSFDGSSIGQTFQFKE